MTRQFARPSRLFLNVAAMAILAGCGGGGGGGGEWLDVIPAVQYHVNESLALAASAKIPVTRDLNDQLQFTTNYAFRLSLSYVFGNDASP